MGSVLVVVCESVLIRQAALWDNVELLEELLSNGAEVDARDSSSRSALHAAALAERSRCLVALCAAGADLDARSATSAGGKVCPDRASTTYSTPVPSALLSFYSL